MIRKKRNPSNLPVGSWIQGFIFSLLIILVLPDTVRPFAGDYVFDRIGIEQGLEHAHVNCIMQDHYGFMWFGTKDGLHRYDGRQFKIFRSVPGDSLSLAGDDVVVLFEDSCKRFWVATTNALHRFDLASETFIRYRSPAKDKLFDKLTYIVAMDEDKSGALWIGTWANGLFRFDPDADSLTSVSLGEKPASPMFMNSVYSLFSNRSDTVWIASALHNLSILNTKTGERRDYQYLDKRKPFQKIMVDRAGRLWSGPMGAALLRIDLQDLGAPQFIRYPDIRPGEHFTSILKDRDGLLWLGTSQFGIILFDPETGERRDLHHRTMTPSSIIGNEIMDIYEDRAGNIWVATTKGVSKWARWRKPFRYYRYNTDDPNSISGENITGISEDAAGNVWISTFNDGICKLNPSTGQIQRYHVRNSRLGVNWTTEILAARDGTIWVGTNWMGGLQRLDFKRDKVTIYQHNPKDSTSIGFNVLNILFEDRQGRVWAGPTNRGLNRYDADHDRFIRYLHNEADSTTISGANVLSMFQDTQGRLWIGTDNGLNLFDEQTEQFQRYLYTPKTGGHARHGMHVTQQSDNRLKIYAMCEDRQGTFWLGTDRGLFMFDRETGKAKKPEANSAFREPGVYAIYADENGYLWLQQIHELIRYDPTTGAAVTYDREDGFVQDVNFFQEWLHASAQLKSGDLLFGGAQGITRFNPAEIIDNPYIPHVYITGMDVLYQPITPGHDVKGEPYPDDAILAHPILFTDHIRLNYSQRTFAFEYVALDYTQPGANQYAFMLEGFHDDWVYAGNETKASFTNIPAGKYIFRVKASNNDGLWNEAGASIAVTVLPPWWRTNTAIVLYVLLAAFGFLGARRMELNRINMRNQLKMKAFEARKLDEVNQMKSRFFANISHEFRTPLTLILGPLTDLINSTTDPQQQASMKLMQRNARRLLRLINQLLDLSRLESGRAALKVHKGNIVAFLRGVCMSFASAADMKNVSLTFSNLMEQTDDPEPLVYMDSDRLEKIFYNLISNAIKYTNDGGQVIVSIQRAQPGDGKGEPQLKITISDNGPGIPEDQLPMIFDRFYRASTSQKQAGAGIGLALTKELVELHHGQIEVHSEYGVGSEFVVWMPLSDEPYAADEIVEPEAPTIDGVGPAEADLVPEDVGPYTAGVVAADTTDISDDATIVLVVEDHADVRAYIRGHLGGDYHVVEAVDGQDGLDKALEVIPDIVISDVMMPRLDGFQLCEALKTDPKTSHIPVILLTARAGEDDKLAGLETGADDYLAKPFNSKELHVRIRNLIEQRRRLRERFRKEGMLQPREVAVTSVDEQFLQRLMSEIEEHLGEAEFGVEALAAALHIGRRQLLRKIKALTNQTPTDLIRTVRLCRARQLIEQHAASISEIAYEVGFDNLSYFARCFKEEFGKLPRELAGEKPKHQAD